MSGHGFWLGFGLGVLAFAMLALGVLAALEIDYRRDLRRRRRREWYAAEFGCAVSGRVAGLDLRELTR